MWEEIGDGVRPAKHRCKCYCFSWDRCYSYSYSYSTIGATPTPTPWTNKEGIQRTETRMYTFRDGRRVVIFNTHTILLTKSIASIENWKSNNKKRIDTRIRKTVTMMGWRDCCVVSCRQPWACIHSDGCPTVFNIHTILLATVHTRVGLVWFILIRFGSVRFDLFRLIIVATTVTVQQQHTHRFIHQVMQSNQSMINVLLLFYIDVVS